ncbi:MAG: ATP-binding cassette domain-containing protein, partial [Oscillospiraceae bacterium]
MLTELEDRPVGELLEIKNLDVAFTGGGESASVISGLSFSLGANECLGIVGESGSGKSVTSLSIMRLLP